MQSVAKHICYDQSIYNEELSFLNDKENHFYLLVFKGIKVYTDTMGSYSNTKEVNRGSFLLLFLLLSVIRNVHFLQTRLRLFRSRSYQRLKGE